MVDRVTGAERVHWWAIDLEAYKNGAAPHDKRRGRTHQLEGWNSFLGMNVAEWPCPQVRSLALRFAGDPDFCYGWRPQYAAFASGKLVHPDGDRQWPHQLPPPSDPRDGE